ncbi:MAG: oligosaccharide flippase family protein, partial [Trueperaceae bacterium]|nr:oligosaccharide flippase family protein [Trueperaceae bacterium]
LGPVAMGVWYLLNLVLQYGAMVHLGALNGMNREIPGALARNDPEEAQRVRGVALGFVLVSYVVAMAVLGGVLVPFGVVPTGLLAWLMAGLLAAQQLYSFALMDLKVQTKFLAVARLQLISALTFPLATIPLAFTWGLGGFVAGQIIVLALSSAIAAVQAPGLFRPRFHLPQSIHLIRIGFPIMLVGITHAVFATVDRWVIQAQLGAEALGHYSLAIMALGAVNLLPHVVAQQVYPRMVMAWSRKPNWSSLEPLMARQRWTALAVSVPAVLVVFAVAPWGIRTFLPAYVPGIPALLITMAIPIINVAGLGFGHAFNVIGLQHWTLAAIATAAIANLSVSLLLVKSLGLSGVAIGTNAGFLVFASVMILAGALVRRSQARHDDGADAPRP